MPGSTAHRLGGWRNLMRRWWRLGMARQSVPTAERYCAGCWLEIAPEIGDLPRSCDGTFPTRSGHGSPRVSHPRDRRRESAERHECTCMSGYTERIQGHVMDKPLSVSGRFDTQCRTERGGLRHPVPRDGGTDRDAIARTRQVTIPFWMPF